MNAQRSGRTDQRFPLSLSPFFFFKTSIGHICAYFVSACPVCAFQEGSRHRSGHTCGEGAGALLPNKERPFITCARRRSPLPRFLPDVGRPCRLWLLVRPARCLRVPVLSRAQPLLTCSSTAFCFHSLSSALIRVVALFCLPCVQRARSQGGWRSLWQVVTKPAGVCLHRGVRKPWGILAAFPKCYEAVMGHLLQRLTLRPRPGDPEPSARTHVEPLLVGRGPAQADLSSSGLRLSIPASG